MSRAGRARRRPWLGPAVAAAVVGWGAVLPATRLGPRGRAVLSAAVGAAAVSAARASGLERATLGLDPVHLVSGARWGAAAATVPLAAYGVMLAVPSLRSRLVDEARAEREDFYEWVGLHIPFGTVAAEELLFRSVLAALLGPGGAGSGLHAAAFGLWHVRPARDAGHHVLGTVLVTGLSAVVFDGLRRRSGSVLAPALLHLALNVGGAVAVRLAGLPPEADAAAPRRR
ncbi:CPBP family intramembrane metalloprotease [Rhodococcus sp. 14C212]|uniref:CPBP family glutamic-type intramembrane protease n=1 Tax=Rhodococcus sp. 14C212 TaxID=2711209 RepID=UPI0013EB4D8D|nr:CPBP family intramembrane metalloprotease [Rhodococcus sp. 14C212]